MVARLALSLLCALAQIVGGFSAPLYVCLCAADGVCIDRGPEHCQCAHAAACHDHDGEEHIPPAPAGNQLEAPDDCLHVRLASPAAASATVTARTQFAHPAALCFTQPAQSDAVSISVVRDATLLFWACHNRPHEFADLSSVMLRL